MHHAMPMAGIRRPGAIMVKGSQPVENKMIYTAPGRLLSFRDDIRSIRCRVYFLKAVNFTAHPAFDIGHPEAIGSDGETDALCARSCSDFRATDGKSVCIPDGIGVSKHPFVTCYTYR